MSTTIDHSAHETPTASPGRKPTRGQEAEEGFASALAVLPAESETRGAGKANDPRVADGCKVADNSSESGSALEPQVQETAEPAEAVEGESSTLEHPGPQTATHAPQTQQDQPHAEPHAGPTDAAEHGAGGADGEGRPGQLQGNGVQSGRSDANADSIAREGRTGDGEPASPVQPETDSAGKADDATAPNADTTEGKPAKTRDGGEAVEAPPEFHVVDTAASQTVSNGEHAGPEATAPAAVENEQGQPVPAETSAGHSPTESGTAREGKAEARRDAAAPAQRPAPASENMNQVLSGSRGPWIPADRKSTRLNSSHYS